MAEIHRVVESNPEFGIKRVANLLKEQNPDWTLGDKRGMNPLQVTRMMGNAD